MTSNDHPNSSFTDYLPLYEELGRKYDAEIQKLLTEIGYVFVKKQSQVCRENPKENRRRFVLHHTEKIAWSWGILLWYGTSEFIPCEITPFPTKEEDFGAYESATRGEDTVIKLSAVFINNKSNEMVLEIKIWDDGKILSSNFAPSLQRFTEVSEATKFLKQIKDAIA